MLTDEIIRYLTKHELFKLNEVPEITPFCLDNYCKAASLIEEYKTSYTRYIRTPHELIESFYDLLLVAQEKLDFGLFDAIEGADFVSKYPSRWKTLEPKDFVFCSDVSYDILWRLKHYVRCDYFCENDVDFKKEVLKCNRGAIEILNMVPGIASPILRQGSEDYFRAKMDDLLLTPLTTSSNVDTDQILEFMRNYGERLKV